MEFMTDDNVSDVIEDFRHQLAEDLIAEYVPKKAYAEQWDIEGLDTAAKSALLMELPLKSWAEEEGIADEEMLKRLKDATDQAAAQLSDGVDKSELQRAEKQILLQVIDRNWREHLQQLDALKSVIGMRAYGQRDPLNEYKSEAFTLFDKLLVSLREDVTKAMMGTLLNVQMQRQQAQLQGQAPTAAPQTPPVARDTRDLSTSGGLPEENTELPAGALDGVSRNSPCPCGSGRKVKHCHGKVT
jgi:preprotein translocase subunit SecA